MEFLYPGLIVGLMVAIFLSFKNAKDAKKQGNKKLEKQHKIIGIVCSVAVVIAFSLRMISVLNTPSRYAQANNHTNTAVAQMLTYENFIGAYNENAAKFKIENTDDWEVQQGEKADVAGQRGEDWGVSVYLSKTTPAIVNGVSYIYAVSEDQLKNYKKLLMSYVLILSCDPSVAEETVTEFCNELLSNMGNEIISNGGVKYTLQEVGGNLVLFIIRQDSSQ